MPPDTCAVISPQAHRTVLPTRSLNKQPPHCKPTMQQQPPHCKPTMLPQQTATSLQTYDAPSTTHPSPLLLLNKSLPYVRKFALPLRPHPPFHTTAPRHHAFNNWFPLISHLSFHTTCSRRDARAHHKHTTAPLHRSCCNLFPLVSHHLQQHSRLHGPPMPNCPLPTSAHTTDTTYQH